MRSCPVRCRCPATVSQSCCWPTATAGGYPTVATVISADLGRLAACKPGQTLRFARVDAAEAEAIAREAEAALKKALDAIVPLSGESHVDLKALYNTNLLSGMVNALAPDGFDDTESES